MRKMCQTPDCDEEIPVQKGSARPRKYCEKCRPPRNRANPHVVHLGAASEPPADPAPAPATLADTYRKQLEACERLDTPEGAHVMLLAEMFAAGGHTASGAATLSRELRAAMEVALRGAPRQADALDELDARRRAKAASA